VGKIKVVRTIGGKRKDYRRVCKARSIKKV
jgi:hypothetical protein